MQKVLATPHVLVAGQGRSRAFAIFGMALGTGGAVGFLLGGWLVTLDPVGLGWRGMFLVNLPISALVAPASALAGLVVTAAPSAAQAFTAVSERKLCHLG